MPGVLETIGPSASGSTRHKPLLESPYHKCRTGLPVNWLMAVPCKITPEVGEVTEDKPNVDQSCVLAHRVVVVGVLISVTFCALADDANAMSKARPNSTNCTGNGSSRLVSAWLLLIQRLFFLSSQLAQSWAAGPE